jgi:hypothetical protein
MRRFDAEAGHPLWKKLMDDLGDTDKVAKLRPTIN